VFYTYIFLASRQNAEQIWDQRTSKQFHNEMIMKDSMGGLVEWLTFSRSCVLNRKAEPQQDTLCLLSVLSVVIHYAALPITF
jgi:hypothetical protein